MRGVREELDHCFPWKQRLAAVLGTVVATSTPMWDPLWMRDFRVCHLQNLSVPKQGQPGNALAHMLGKK